MKTSYLISLGLATFLAVLTIYGWMDRLQGTNTKLKEGFSDAGELLTSDAVLNHLKQANERAPTPDDAVKAHRTLLLFIQNDFSRGIKFVDDFGNRFFNTTKLRSDLDTRTLMSNYVNPLIL